MIVAAAADRSLIVQKGLPFSLSSLVFLRFTPPPPLPLTSEAGYRSNVPASSGFWDSFCAQFPFHSVCRIAEIPTMRHFLKGKSVSIVVRIEHFCVCARGGGGGNSKLLNGVRSLLVGTIITAATDLSILCKDIKRGGWEISSVYQHGPPSRKVYVRTYVRGRPYCFIVVCYSDLRVEGPLRCVAEVSSNKAVCCTTYV